MAKIGIELAAICDDVRKEVTGKYNLIGVYDEGVTFTQLPVNWQFNLVLRIRADAAYEGTLTGSIDYSGKTLSINDMTVNVPRAGTFLVPLKVVLPDINRPGTVAFALRLGSAMWKDSFGVRAMPQKAAQAG
ncbi:DUF6941 family protein [Ancylobacter terrae]|uniref:DUF6941 family protein n=1 Tax=Ancylobacter sp. sgz301288 TaxID=3342077 RepID=UPI00385BF34A